MSDTKKLNDALELIDKAAYRIKSNEPLNAIWRLADAAGLLNETTKDDGENVIGRDIPTGRGYMLPTSAATIKTVAVEVRSVYGNDTIYPANFEAERFAAIAGKKTLSRTDLMNIKALGFAVEEVAIKKLAA